MLSPVIALNTTPSDVDNIAPFFLVNITNVVGEITYSFITNEVAPVTSFEISVAEYEIVRVNSSDVNETIYYKYFS